LKSRRHLDATFIRKVDLLACGTASATKRILIFGDSQSMILIKALEPSSAVYSLRVDQATRFATAPLLDFDHLAI
jgi:hypothetical protein